MPEFECERCRLEYELGLTKEVRLVEQGRGVRRNVRKVPCEVCDPHAAPSVKKITADVVGYIKGLKGSQPDIDLQPFLNDAQEARGFYEKWEERYGGDPGSVVGFLRAADDTAEAAQKQALWELIRTRDAQLAVILEGPPVTIPIHTDDPEVIKRLKAQQADLDRIRDRFERAHRQMARNIAALESRGVLMGKPWWNVFRDTTAIAIKLYPWMRAYLRGQSQVEKHLEKRAERAAEATTRLLSQAEEGERAPNGEEAAASAEKPAEGTIAEPGQGATTGGEPSPAPAEATALEEAGTQGAAREASQAEGLPPTPDEKVVTAGGKAETTLDNGIRVSGPPTAVAEFLASGGSKKPKGKSAGQPKPTTRRRRGKPSEPGEGES
jgi:hypothetical protein